MGKIKNDTIYTASYQDGFHFVEKVEKSNLIGKKISQVLVRKHPELSHAVCNSLKIGPNDTVVIVEEYTSYMIGQHGAYIKYGNKLKYLSFKYGWNKKDLRHSSFRIWPIEEILTKPKKGDNMMMEIIMLNVMFNWDIPDIECFLSSGGGSNNAIIAKRYILNNYIISQYSEIKFEASLFWDFKNCYENDRIPRKYFRDLTASSDSTIEKYMQGYVFDTYFWE